jgi:hypothetical protein
MSRGRSRSDGRCAEGGNHGCRNGSEPESDRRGPPWSPNIGVRCGAREVLDARGYGKAFMHGTRHGVGFAAINHNALPRIHPLSDEILEPEMVFNIEPAVYIPEVGGLRQCNMLAVTEDGVE